MDKKRRAFGVSAAYPKKMLRQSYIRSFYFMFLSLISLLISLYFFFTILPYNRVLSTFGFVTMIIGFLNFTKSRKKIFQGLAGVRAEQLTSDLLVRETNGIVVNGVIFDLNKGDTDHVYIGHTLAAIETKSGHGELVYLPKSRMILNGKLMYRNPLAQTRKNAQQLSKLSGKHAKPILVITFMEGEPRELEGVIVTNLKHLPKVIKQLPVILDEKEALIIFEKLNYAH